MRSKRWRGVRTFNLAVWSKDFYAVNGFDEAFQGWGHEDADLAVRLINNKVRRKDGQFAIPVLHLWHKDNDRDRLVSNIEMLNKTVYENAITAHQGLIKS